MLNDYIKKIVKNADHVERVTADEYIVTIVDPREMEVKVVVKKYLSGVSCQWSMTVNGTRWIYNAEMEKDGSMFFGWLQDKAFMDSEEQRNNDRANVESFFANLTTD